MVDGISSTLDATASGARVIRSTTAVPLGTGWRSGITGPSTTFPQARTGLPTHDQGGPAGQPAPRPIPADRSIRAADPGYPAADDAGHDAKCATGTGGGPSSRRLSLVKR